MPRNTHPIVSYMLRLILFVVCFIAATCGVIALSSRFSCPMKPIRSFSVQKDEMISAQRENGKKKSFYIVLDAGHGGEDGGAVSDKGVPEKDLNLDIARKLYSFLKLSDYSPVLVRDDDRLLYKTGQENRKKYYDLINRVETAQQYAPAVFVSIHQNKFPIRKYKGFQVYCSKNNPNSALLGTIMQQNVRRYLQPDNNREIKIADNSIRVLDSLSMPAVLAECGFLSNESEAELLCTEEYRAKLSYVLFCSVMQYLNENKDGLI